MQDDITPVLKAITILEGETASLSCTYSAISVNNLQWFRQNPGSKPEFIILMMESSKYKVESTPPHPRVSAEVYRDAKRVDLNISSAEVSDSAVYYCALEPTVSGNPAALNKNPPSI